MQHIDVIAHAFGMQITCLRCGNAESPPDMMLQYFRIEGYSKESSLLRCLNCNVCDEVRLADITSWLDSTG
ncbi:hypothetical protein [Franzmannia qiaohouensis]|uniref:Uncharacterized protein n=1 Tax=Franzmannia qiaohouensis TaxID=1329370 RepID=A0ABU1HE67_9GAMM|nr:hypothetical protein [Halomonas qiaohouensis]MDR5904890.1 hypothetical protein [Halomonas qiaohouensis]